MKFFRGIIFIILFLCFSYGNYSNYADSIHTDSGLHDYHNILDEEIEKYKKDGSYEERLEYYKNIQNHEVNPVLVKKMVNKINKLRGYNNHRDNEVPTRWVGMQTIGKVKAVTLLIDFPDYKNPQVEGVEDIQSKMFGDGFESDYPYESIRNFYLRSSYGKLEISGNVLGWYTAKYNRDHYNENREELIKEAISYYKKNGHDFSQYDANNDGIIDALYVEWAGPNTGWASFWWSCQPSFGEKGDFVVDGKRLKHYVWCEYPSYNLKEWEKAGYNANVDIHETGHMLGLPDYYDYDPDIGLP